MANPFLTAPWNWSPRNPSKPPTMPSMPPLPMGNDGPPGGETPNIWPIPPKPIVGDGPRMPEMPSYPNGMDSAVPFPEGLVGAPNAYDTEDIQPGRATYGGPALHSNPSALRGLMANQQNNPIFGLIGLASQARQGNSIDRGRAGGIESFINQTLDPQRQQVRAIEAGIAQHHPAIQEGKEADAIRASYPSKVAAEGNQAAATIGAQGRLGAASATLQGNQARANATKMSAALRGLTDAMQPVQGEDGLQDPKAQQRIQFWLGILQQLQGGGVPSGVDLDEFDTDEF